LERLKEQARRLGDNQEVNELQDEIDQINREIKMNAGKTRDKKFSMKDHGYVVNRIGSYEIIEGAGVDGGWWYAKERKGRPPLETKKFKTRREAEEHARMSTDDAAYDPTTPKNIAKAKALSVAQGKAASDAKVEVKQQSDVGSNQWGIYVDGKLVEGGFFSKSAAEEASVQYSKDEAYDPLDPENILKEKELAKARGAAAADVKDALFKGQKVTAIKSEQGLREGEVYTVLGEEAIIKQIVCENDTTVYKLQDSSGNVIVIESPEGLFYEVLDAYDDGYEAAKNGKPISDNPFKDRSRSGWGDFKESWDDGWRNGNKNKDSKTKDKEEENESLKVKIGEIKKNMDAARKMGFDTAPYQKEIDKLEAKDSLSYVTTYKGYEIASSDKNIADKFLTTSKGTFLAANTLEELKKKIDKLETKDAYEGANIKNGYYAAMTGKARTENPFTKGTPEYTEWDRKWKIGSEDFKYESNKELFKPKDSDDKELKEMLVNDAPDYYGAIVATARRGNNPQMGSKEVRKNLEPFMSAHGVQFNEEEFNKAYKEFNKAGVSKAAFMKGTDAADVYTKDPLTKKGEKILAAMKKVYGEEKGEQIFYASKNKGTISGVDKKIKDAKVRDANVVFKKLGWKVEVPSDAPNEFWVRRPDGYTTGYSNSLEKAKTSLEEGIALWKKLAERNPAKYGEYLKLMHDSKTKDEEDISKLKNKALTKVLRDFYEGVKEINSPSAVAGAQKLTQMIQSETDINKLKMWAGDSKTKDQEIKIIIGDDPVTPSPAEQKVEGNDVIYKEYTLKQLPETGEFEVYAPGGSIVGHAKALELAKLFVDRIVASRVGDEWSEEARKKL